MGALSIAAVAFVAIVVGLAFGLALGVRYAEPRFKDAKLHDGEWLRTEVVGNTVIWKRQGERRRNCDEGHRAFICTITSGTEHVDACDCTATRAGVYGSWS